MTDTAIVLASGPSLTADDIARIRGHGITITINTTFRDAPWADYHYSNDDDWFRTYIDEIRDRCSGVPVCGHETWRHPEVCSDWQIDRSLPGISTTPPILGWGGNSGFAGINLAYHFGVRRVLILGFDMGWQGSKSHHHGHHPKHLQHRKPGFHRWLKYYNRAAIQYNQAGVEIVNCSRRTALTCFRRSTLDAEL